MKKDITSEDLARVAQSKMKNTTSIDWNGLNVIIKNMLSLPEMLLFVDTVVKSCFDDDGNYCPEHKGFAIRSTTITMYTNITLPDDITVSYSIVYGTDLVEKVMKYVRRVQFDKIIEAIDKKIDYLTDARVWSLNKQVDILIDSLESIEGKASAMFSNINNDDITKLIQTISSNSFSEREIVKAVLEENE